MNFVTNFLLFDIISNPCILLDNQNKIFSVNKWFVDLTKRNPDYFIDKSATVLFPDIQKCVDNPKKEELLLFTLGKNKNMLITAHFEKDLHGGILYLHPEKMQKGSNHRVLLKNQLLSNKLHFFQSFLDSSTDGIAVYNHNGDLVYMNIIASQLLGIESRKLQKYSIWQTESIFEDELDWKVQRQRIGKKKGLEYQREMVSKKDAQQVYLSVKITSKVIDNEQYFLSTSFDVTEKEMTKRALEEKDNQLEILRKNLPAVIFQLVINDQLETYFTYVNNRFEELFGFKIELNSKVLKFDAKIHPDDFDNFNTQFAQSFLNKAAFSFIGRVILANEQIKWIEIHSLPTHNQNTVSYNGIINDITLRKEAEIAVQKRRLFNDSILNNIPADIAVFDKDHKYLFLNSTAVKDQVTREWMIGKTDFDYCAYKNVPNDLAQLRRHYYNQAKESRNSVEWLDSYNKNGELSYVLRRFFPFFIEDKFEYMIGYGMDVTQLKQAQSEVFKNQQRYQLILNSALDAIIMLKSDGTITFWNPMAETIFGWTSQEVLGQNLGSYIVPDRLQKSFTKAFRQFNLYQESKLLNRLMELHAVNKANQEFPIELTVLPINEQDGTTSFCAFIRDISIRKQREKEIEDKNTKLRLQNRQLEQFTYIASHDLQEPLLTLMSFSELLKDEHYQRLDEEGQLFVEFIYKSAVRMRSLVTGLMEYARIGRLEKLETIDVQSVIAEILHDLQASIQKKSAVISVAHMPVIKGHPTYLRLLLQNLVSNSLKFSKNNVPPQISISYSETDQEWLFAVEDNGIGIDPKHHDEVFTIFKKLNTHERYEGFGFGLSHCKKIAEMHDGDLWIASELDKGSTFFFSISKTI